MPVFNDVRALLRQMVGHLLRLPRIVSDLYDMKSGGHLDDVLLNSVDVDHVAWRGDNLPLGFPPTIGVVTAVDDGLLRHVEAGEGVHLTGPLEQRNDSGYVHLRRQVDRNPARFAGEVLDI
ncbi:hypothetical protein D3C71_1546610 [compost metagenome]